MAHSNLTRFTKAADQVMMGLNLVLLLFVSFLPFTTSLLANHLDDSAAHIAVVIFGINLTLASLMVNVMFGYASRTPGVAADDAADAELKAFDRQRRVAVIVQAVATLLGLILPLVAVVVYLVISLLVLVDPILARRARAAGGPESGVTTPTTRGATMDATASTDEGEGGRAASPAAATSACTTRRRIAGTRCQVLVEQGARPAGRPAPHPHGRMAASPFAFLRGAAAVMAADLAPSPVTGLRVQAIGDAHLSNFGVFATPERRLVFDVNDFDETLPAPWEWDVKRLVASVPSSPRRNGAGRGRRHGGRSVPPAPIARRCATSPPTDAGRLVRAPRRRPTSYSSEASRQESTAATRRRSTRSAPDELSRRRQARRGCRREAALPEPAAARLRRSRPRPRRGGPRRGSHSAGLHRLSSRALAPERRRLLDRFRIVDMARKVVGVGSVGTRCLVASSSAATTTTCSSCSSRRPARSVLAPYAGASEYEHQGERVVHGQRLVQVASDVFLGWNASEEDQHYYWRQLKT